MTVLLTVRAIHHGETVAITAYVVGQASDRILRTHS